MAMQLLHLKTMRLRRHSSIGLNINNIILLCCHYCYSAYPKVHSVSAVCIVEMHRARNFFFYNILLLLFYGELLGA